MLLDMTIRNFESSPASNELAETMLQDKLKRFVLDDDTVKAVISKDGRTFKTVITVKAYGSIIRGEAVELNKIPSIRAATDDLIRKIRKAKTRNISSRKSKNNNSSIICDLDVEEYSIPKITRSKERTMETLSLDEALFNAEMLGHSFYVYRETDGNTAVLYKRKDNTYGKILYI